MILSVLAVTDITAGQLEVLQNNNTNRTEEESSERNSIIQSPRNPSIMDAIGDLRMVVVKRDGHTLLCCYFCSEAFVPPSNPGTEGRVFLLSKS